MNELFSNQILWTAIIANAEAQILKAILVVISERQWRLDRLFGPGGMPSSHAALVTALATGIAFTEGFASPVFAGAAVFALIVMYDAVGVRQAAGKHALVLNQVTAELHEMFKEGFKPEVLQVFLGHNSLQVIAGFILGLSVALFSFIVWPG
ncbi:MAG: divergent PAP2 family protein [Candidatus Fermentibacteraceae bacterium]